MANTTQYNDFNLPIDGYAAFDALSLKNLIIKRLNSSNTYTDQRYEGSNLSAVIDIIAYAYHVLLFYLNRTSSESTFTTAELYENVNKIVKLIGYNPIGKQTSILPFKATSNGNLEVGTFTIPRYSFFNINGTVYSFNNDITFTNPSSKQGSLMDLQDNNLLYQGVYTEYPSYFATGAPNETIIMALTDPNGQNISIDHFNIDVYVKDNSVTNAKWVKWTATQSLFLERSNATKYEIRLNENSRYEIKFGDNIAGKQLSLNSEVAIYYLQTAEAKGEIGLGLLDNKLLYFYKTTRYNSILADTFSVNLTPLTQLQSKNILFTNTESSTQFIDIEDANSIKSNAPKTFRSQFRLITTDDFITYISKNYSNIISSVKVVNNYDYISGHMKYFFDLGVTNPNNESRVLFNQVKFSNTCNFNNVYIYAVPKLIKTSSLNTRTNYLNNTQKQLIINELQNVKLTTAEIIVNDPVYTAVDLGIAAVDEKLLPSISDTTNLVITRSFTSKIDEAHIKQVISSIFTKYFSTTNDNLGLKLSITDLTNQILAIEGVLNISTQRTINGVLNTVPGISLMLYNPVYSDTDIVIITQDINLPYFKFPYLNNQSNFANKIKVINSNTLSI